MEILDLGPIFFANYSQDCVCGERVEEGDEARMSDGELIGQQCCGQDFEDANKEAMGAWG